jgi:hypothetical protein
MLPYQICSRGKFKMKPGVAALPASKHPDRREFGMSRCGPAGTGLCGSGSSGASSLRQAGKSTKRLEGQGGLAPIENDLAGTPAFDSVATGV